MLVFSRGPGTILVRMTSMYDIYIVPWNMGRKSPIVSKVKFPGNPEDYDSENV